MRSLAVVTAMLLTCSGNVALGADKFEKIAVYLEQNIQDADAEVKFEVIGPSMGLAVLRVAAPDGRIVVDFKAPDSKMGIRHLTLETPEPRNDGRLQADFPEGTYKFTGTTTGGATLHGEARLTHGLPKAASVVRPRPDEKNIPVGGLRITWKAVNDVEAIAVVIEQGDTGQEVRAVLPGKATAFAVPNGFLAGATTYKLAIGTVAKGGNKTVTETSFTTAAKK